MTAPTRGKRGSRRGEVLASLDTQYYNDLIRQAIFAFGRDTAYSIDMARAAATIESKRNVWRKRLADRKSEESSLLS